MDKTKWTKQRKALCKEFWEDCGQEKLYCKNGMGVPCDGVLDAEKERTTFDGMDETKWKQILFLSIVGLVLIAALSVYKLIIKAPNPSQNIQYGLVIVVGGLGVLLLVSAECVRVKPTLWSKRHDR